MGRIIKALIFGWIGKKIYDFTLGRRAEPNDKPLPARAQARPARKQPARRTARA